MALSVAVAAGAVAVAMAMVAGSLLCLPFVMRTALVCTL